jgi:hypothetical protein
MCFLDDFKIKLFLKQKYLAKNKNQDFEWIRVGRKERYHAKY